MTYTYHDATLRYATLRYATLRYATLRYATYLGQQKAMWAVAAAALCRWTLWRCTILYDHSLLGALWEHNHRHFGQGILTAPVVFL